MSPWRAVVAFVSRVRDLCARRRLAREAEQEIEMHLDLLAARYVRAGKPPAEARRLARAKFGGVAQVRESLRDQAGFPMIESVVRDVRYAARGLLRNPGFSLVVVLTLGVGVGANAAVFSFVDAVLLQPLPYPEADRLVAVQETGSRGFSAEGVGTMLIRPPEARFEDSRGVIDFFSDVLARASAVPGVESAGLVSQLPASLRHGPTVELRIERRQRGRHRAGVGAGLRHGVRGLLVASPAGVAGRSRAGASG